MTDYSHIPAPDPTRPPTAEEAKLFAEAVESVERGEGCIYYGIGNKGWTKSASWSFSSRPQQYRPIPERKKVTFYYSLESSVGLQNQDVARNWAEVGHTMKVLEFYPDELPDYVPEEQEQ